MKTQNKIITLGLLFTAFANQSFAYAPIIRDFHSVRAAGMGDVRYTTGEFEENFYANPARITDNPDSRFQLPQLSFEAGSTALSTLSTLTSSGNKGLSGFKGVVGEPLSARFQMVFPGYYSRNFITEDWSLGIGMLLSAQTVAEVGQSGSIDPLVLMNVGPSITVARRLLDENRLTVGVTARTEFRANANSNFSIQDFLGGTKVSDAVKGGNGAGFDFDLGTTFKPHWTLGGFSYQVGFAINNIMDGKYTNIGKPIKTDWSADPLQSPRTYNFGVSARHTGIPVFDSVLFALEVTDIGNNTNGSFYRLLHAGSEAKWKDLIARVGLNQGYYTAGFGIDLGFFNANLATYGEELGLNAGVREDRRYALQIGFEI